MLVIQSKGILMKPHSHLRPNNFMSDLNFLYLYTAQKDDENPFHLNVTHAQRFFKEICESQYCAISRS